MKFLTRPVGRFPLGIWIALVILLITGLCFTLFGQALSLLSWDTALSLGLQEDSPHSTDIVTRMMGAVSWGEAAVDVPVQGTLIVLTLLGIWLRRPFGFVAGVGQAILWIYVPFLVTLERIGLYRWGMVPDLSRAETTGPLVFIIVGIPGVILLISLLANRRFFEHGQETAPPRAA